jgi:hypothetical protein
MDADPENNETELVKIIVEMDDGSESLWAKPLGDSLYELHNIPAFAEGLHPLDVVRCEERANDLPAFVELVSRSGYEVIGISFTEIDDQSVLLHIDPGTLEKQQNELKEQQVEVMVRLRELGVTWEKVTSGIFNLAIAPDMDYEEILHYLEEKHKQGLLEYEEYE